MKLIIAGSRTFNNYNLLEYEVKKFILKHSPKSLIIISGTANGADKLGELFAKNYNIQIEAYPANWNEFGKRAGPIRNKEMVDNATHAIYFWDGKSSGTANCIKLAQEKQLIIEVINY